MKPLSELQNQVLSEAREHAHLKAIRAYNHSMIHELDEVYPLEGKDLLDLGSSVHGYALEAALEHGVAAYEGIDLGISRHWQSPMVEFATPDNRVGRLRQMNAEELQFEDSRFDCLMTISTFEHFMQPVIVLDEMFRVLKPGGVALVSFEPIWTAPNGHHLHHFGSISDLVPPWSHLFLTEAQMNEVLARKPWPADAPISLVAALHWIYRDVDINRIDIRELSAIFERSRFEVSWIHPLRDPASSAQVAVAEYVARFLPYTTDELLTRGLSILLRKP